MYRYTNKTMWKLAVQLNHQTIIMFSIHLQIPRFMVNPFIHVLLLQKIRATHFGMTLFSFITSNNINFVPEIDRFL